MKDAHFSLKSSLQTGASPKPVSRLFVSSVLLGLAACGGNLDSQEPVQAVAKKSQSNPTQHTAKSDEL